MVKRVLMIAYHYPPLRGSSGIQRTLKFSRYLSEHEWSPVVLSAHPRSYASTSDDQVAEIPKEVPVHRAFALDTSRHLAIKGRYLGWLALPDRWVTWWLGAVPAGLRMIRKYQPEVIWSTYPIATAHLIGLALHRITGIPWVADMRDPMTDTSYPANPLTRKVYRWIERKTVTHATKIVCTTPGTIRMYRERFPDIPASRFCVIENGYDEENFQSAESAAKPSVSGTRPFTLVHSGVIYPSERDPRPFFEALSELLRNGRIAPGSLQVTLRATGHDGYLKELIAQHKIESVVVLAPPIPYRDALAEMLAADGLLILQASNCNHQIPAKLYEYLRARRPILALTDPEGDTASTLRAAGVRTIARLDSASDILRGLIHFLDAAAAGQADIPTVEAARNHSRRARSKELAAVLETAVVAKEVWDTGNATMPKDRT
ncbi:glycosyltransferase [Noviherbaspirillum denitrificans]|uniref:Glycosyltransferase n=1 Tax=Noviherbaspirillum denitrificans TaxID=1968433 RepID=A0A254TCN1_9BURK|nr:glycosyltransferase [Noviherbaspirillum denitrificans]OWW20391.1 glycosyltransferase [Noviherbaspirillum denitrificans]